ESPGDEQDPGSAARERRSTLRRELHPLHEVGTRAEELERSQREIGEVQPRVCITSGPQSLEPPENARRTDVEVLHRARAVPTVPIVRLPEELRSPQRGVRVRDDLGDSLTSPSLVPALAGQRLEEPGRVQHPATLAMWVAFRAWRD